ncbi:hypothetical protein scyTo_0021688 [Scyliorhinus torazame]|uniref:Uncharacterized protein n=1 Tax=Scyliorhinus torazame TaxID=75743 RepID=A0A401QBE3_SCYTO|nr:hypothetical protein [Scyliorhinus torazame]
MRQLNEERQHFALLMKRRLAPRVNRWASLPQCPPKKPLRATYSTVNLSENKDTKTLVECPSEARSEVDITKSKLLKVSYSHFTAKFPKITCTCSHKKLLKRTSSLPNLQFAISDL